MSEQEWIKERTGKADFTDEEWLDFISDLVNDGLKKYDENYIAYSTGMALLACNNLVLYLRRLKGKVNEQ